ncbi:MAG: hypothetical protein KDD55_07285 [Bdellovibrionales bacterium]|nr:hypothetical protein [Bdellovibrionales bacterium]
MDPLKKQRKKELERISNKEWRDVIERMKGVTYLSLDDAITILIDNVLERLGLEEDGGETAKFLYMLVNGDEELLFALFEELDIKKPY